MLPKSGDPHDPGNWRPLAILDASYKVFAKVLYQRLAPILEPVQSDDQMGFRAKRGTDDALVIVESVIATSLEYRLPVYVLSIDLSKAFDRIEHDALLEALREHNLPEGYLALLSRLYSDQRGILDGQHAFGIRRGVRQGDVLSPLLFNVALDSAMAKWKRKLTNHGIRLHPEHERLTNVRYADDLLLFGGTLGEVTFMFARLEEELAKVGLSINGSKTKLLTNGPESHAGCAAVLVEAGTQMVEVVRRGASHKYLGRLFSGALECRGQSNLEHRTSCAWLKFHKHQASLLNKRIPLHLRCKLFSSVVSPSALYSLSTTPLTETQLEKLDATQRRMLRKMVGWVRFDGESWEEVGHRMKARLAAAMEKSQVQPWSHFRNLQRDEMIQRLRSGNGPSLACLAHAWMPGSIRPRGRPRQRWSDHSVH